MRPHFFKGYSKSQKRMLTPTELSFNGVFLGVDGKLSHSEDVILLHFTGEADVNKRPIFEEDVVDFDMVMDVGEEAVGLGIHPTVRKRGVIRYENDPGWYAIVILNEKEVIPWTPKDVLVVGNALVTPKLLELPPVYDNPLERQNQPQKAQ